MTDNDKQKLKQLTRKQVLDQEIPKRKANYETTTVLCLFQLTIKSQSKGMVLQRTLEVRNKIRINNSSEQVSNSR